MCVDRADRSFRAYLPGATPDANGAPPDPTRPQYHFVILDYLVRETGRCALAAGSDALEIVWARADDLVKFDVTAAVNRVLRKAFALAEARTTAAVISGCEAQAARAAFAEAGWLAGDSCGGAASGTVGCGFRLGFERGWTLAGFGRGVVRRIHLHTFRERYFVERLDILERLNVGSRRARLA